jgi:hypothetical protein
MKKQNKKILGWIAGIIVILLIGQFIGLYSLYGSSGTLVIQNGVTFSSNLDTLTIAYSANGDATETNALSPESCYYIQLREDFGSYNIYHDKLGTTGLSQASCQKFGGEWVLDMETTYPYVTQPGCSFANTNLNNYDVIISDSSNPSIKLQRDELINENKLMFCNTHSQFFGTNSEKYISVFSGTVQIKLVPIDETPSNNTTLGDDNTPGDNTNPGDNTIPISDVDKSSLYFGLGILGGVILLIMVIISLRKGKRR